MHSLSMLLVLRGSDHLGEKRQKVSAKFRNFKMPSIAISNVSAGTISISYWLEQW